MNWNETILVFSPPPWPVFLTVAAAALIVYELADLLWGLWRGRSAGSAIGMTIALVGGPVTALAAGVFAGGGSSGGASGAAEGGPSVGAGVTPRRLALSRSAWRFTFLAAMAGAMARWPLAGSVASITACAVVWAVRAYRRTTSDAARATKVGLLLFRISAILLLGLWAMCPQLEFPTRKKVRRAVLIGVDLSSSMRVRDVPGAGPTGAGDQRPGSRIEAVQAVLDGASGDLERIAEEADVHVFGFSAGPQPLAALGDPAGHNAAGAAGQPFKLKLPPATGQATALGDAAMSAADALLKQGSELAGIVLISDGCNNTSQTLTPEKFASRMAMLSVPILTVGAGSDQVTASTRGLSVQDLAAPDQVEAFNRLPIRATVEALGLQGRTIRVSCRFGNESNSPASHLAAAEANDAQVLTVRDSRQSFSVEFTRVPLASGFHRLTVQAECPSPPEGLSGQFMADKLVQVVDHELRVLYLEGVYRYEVKFLTQALAAARFTVDRRIMLQPLRQDQPSPLGENLDDWLRYHAVILGDLSADSLTTKQRQIIKDLVGTYGKGLCMIGGGRSFGRGGWEKTPLADVMPVDLAASAEQIEHEIRVVPTRAGLTEAMMAIGREGPMSTPAQSAAPGGADPASAWAELSVLPGANKLAGVKPGATVLATTGDADRFPLLVAQRYGAGRSLAVAFDTTWLWVTTKDTGDLQRRFWRQAALYLCDPKGNAWVTTDRARYDLARLVSGAEAVEVAAGVEDAQGSPMPEAPVKLTLASPDGRTVPLRLAAEDHRRVARLSAIQLSSPGTYSLKLEAEVAGKPLSAEHRFDVNQRNVEALDVLANFKLLQRLSDQTKGQFVPLADFRDLLVHIADGGAAPRIVQQIEHFDLGGYLRWPVIFALLTLLCLEWALRKRRGLV